MDTGEAAVSGLFGDKLYQLRARRALPILVRQANAGSTILYSELAAELGMSNPRTLNWPLGAIGNELLALGRQWDSKVPPIQTLVVNKTDGIPGEGLSWFAPDAQEFKRSPKTVRRQIVDRMLAQVFSYQKWNQVLNAFGLEPLPPLSVTVPPLQSVWATGTGGEGERHRQLKHTVAAHPEWVGLPRTIGHGETECALYSGDRIDVVFSNNRRLIGVEVKSDNALEADIVRGLFQCVKYEAVLNAEEAMRQTRRECTAVLALGGPLPRNLVGLRLVLGVEVFESLAAGRG